MKFEPRHIMSDFEMSLIKVVKQKISLSWDDSPRCNLTFQFPTAQHHECFFHYCQTLHKNIQSLGLLTAYLDDEEIRLASCSGMALALIPNEHVEEAFELVKENSPSEMIGFFDYLQEQWFKRVPPDYWVVSDLDWRTNNFVEVMYSYLWEK